MRVWLSPIQMMRSMPWQVCRIVGVRDRVSVGCSTNRVRFMTRGIVAMMSSAVMRSPVTARETEECHCSHACGAQYYAKNV